MSHSFYSHLPAIQSLHDTHTRRHTQRVVISIGNEEERIGIEPHADWLAWGWKANYSLFLTTTSDVLLFAVKALTGCTLNILAICPIRFCSPWLKPFKDSAACHFRADWLPNAHIWNTWFQYQTTPSLLALRTVFALVSNEALPPPAPSPPSCHAPSIEESLELRGILINLSWILRAPFTCSCLIYWWRKKMSL